MKLATIVCRRDLKQMILQAESIKKFLSSCEHILLVDSITDDYSDNERFWTTALSEYYTNHNLKIVYPKWSFTNSETDGWVRQQSWKHLIAEYTEQDYLILDAKNFFIKPTSLEQWTDYYCSHIPLNLAESLTRYVTISKMYSDYWQTTEYSIVPYMSTPQVFKYDIVVDHDLYTHMSNFLNMKIPNPNSKMSGYFVSDFLWYFYKSLRCKENKEKWHEVLNSKRKPYSKTLWGPYASLDYMNILNSLETDIKVVGFHRFFINQLDSIQRQQINQWIKSYELFNSI